MTQEQAAATPPTAHPAPSAERRVAAGAVAFAVVALAAITYAKWWPYAGKVAGVVGTHTYSGKSILGDAGAPGTAPTWANAWHFATSYGLDVWIGLVAAVLIGAGAEVLVPRTWLRRALGQGKGLRSSWRGGLLAIPCLMCTCCASPITISLRRSKVPVAGALAYWLGNPLLNPVVLIILAVVLPWQFVVGRIIVGGIIVFAVAPLVARLAVNGRAAAPDVAPLLPREPPPPAPTLARYLWAVVRLAAVILPEYFLVVLAVGAFRGWLLPVHGHVGWAAGAVAGAVIVAAVGGTLLVIPTAAEVPILIGLLAAGVPVVVAGVLLIALPALSLPSMAMVGRWLSWRATAIAAVAVMVCALAAGALVAAL